MTETNQEKPKKLEESKPVHLPQVDKLIETPEKPAQSEKPTQVPAKPRSRTLIWFTIALIIIAVAWFCYWLLYLRFHEYTDDAYANGNLINVNSAISGSIVAFYADDTDLVEEGQLLVMLDTTEYQVAYDLELATLASVVLQVRQLYDTVDVNRANVENRQIALQRAAFDFENRKRLVDTLAVSNEDYIHSKDDLLTAQLNLEQAQFQLQASQSAAGNTKLEAHPLIEQQKGKVREAFYNLKHCSIYAPATGYVAQRAAQVGQWVSPNIDIMAVIPTDYVWVDANYKETQLTGMRIGQPATVWFDIYGDVEFKGKVLGIASGSGSVFSIIPPQNATGNWIKIVQRLPVRISLDPQQIKKYPTRLGISSEVNVDITNRDLPMLAQVPSKKAIGTTRVFDIDFEEVDRVIDEVISKNLKKKP